MKKDFKNKLLYFSLGVMACSIVGVTAATYFPSNDVTYDNKASGLSATNVQTAIDELYNACKVPATGGDGILEKVPIVTSGDGLYKDEYEDGKYTYKGANPNNYITFNNEQAGWRIISINSDKTIKIIKVNSLGYKTWDTSNNNNWTRPATINTYLNETYYNTLNSSTQNQILSANYGIGKITNNNNNLTTQINDENSKLWNGKVALPTLSEYIRANSNKNSCGTFGSYNKNGYTICNKTNWLFSDSTLTLSANKANNFDVFSGGSSITTNDANYAYLNANPVVTINSEIIVSSGTGKKDDPFIIS